jgi:replicative DNA helicase
MHDANVERNALSSIIRNFTESQKIINDLGVTADYFHLDPHAVIFEVVIDMGAKNKPIDFETVWQEVRLRASYMEYADILAIKESGQERPLHWLTLLRQYFYARQILEVFRWSTIKLKDPAQVQEVLAMATEDLFRYQIETSPRGDSLKVDDLINDVGLIPSNYNQINNILIGYARGRPTVIGARPKVGKTTFALCEIVKKLLIPDGRGWFTYGCHCTMFSLEMTRKEIIRNMVCIMSGIKPEIVKRKEMTPEQVKMFKDYFDLINRAPLMIYDHPHTPKQICTNMRYQSEQNNTQFIVIDYFQRMKAKGRKDREFFSVASNDIADAVKNLKSEPALLLFSQLNRDADMDLSRGVRHAAIPRPSDLKETGSLEEDAYTVGLMYWDPESMIKKQKAIEAGRDIDDGVTTTVIHWCMNRGGNSGHSYLKFRKREGRFVDVPLN